MARRPLNISVGRKAVRPSVQYGASQAALRNQLQESLRGVIDNFRTFTAGLEAVMPEILLETLEPTFAKSQIRVPRLTGELADSGYLEARQGSRSAEVEIGYGRGGKPDYAIFVHEIPAHHEEPTSDKFLQGPIEEDLPDIPNILAAKIREAAGT